MSNGVYDPNPPFDYQQQNYYNSLRSPSTVHVKNTRLRRYFRKYLFQKAISVFEWTLPEDWDKNYFLYTLYGLGFVAVLYTDKYGMICQGGSLGGYNLYYRPSYCIITNPLLGTMTAKISGTVAQVPDANLIAATGGKECVIIQLQPDYGNILDIVGYYADMLALAAESAGTNLLNVKSATIFGADDKAKAESFKKMFDRVADGEPGIVIDKKLLDDKGQPVWFPFTQHVKESYVVTDILADMRKIEAMFETAIGIPNANTDKRERLIEDEVNSNNVSTKSLCDLWKENIEKGLTLANKKYNLNLGVEWRYKEEQTETGGEE